MASDPTEELVPLANLLTAIVASSDTDNQLIESTFGLWRVEPSAPSPAVAAAAK